MIRFLVLWPILELLAFILVATNIGFLKALGLILLSTLVGMVILQTCGRTERPAGQAGPLFFAVNVVSCGLPRMVAGWLLLIPGYLTSVFGLCLLFPPTRILVLAWLSKWANSVAATMQARTVYMNPDGTFSSNTGASGPASPGRAPGTDRDIAPENVVIDVDRVDEDK